ncbi:MAG: metallophosphoesterase [Verrucomicrobia bacterium]|nr:metallophosphoesterase [Verrucomicrobiota bacterium]
MISRRLFLGSSLAALLGGGGYSALIESQSLRREKIVAPVAGLASALEGLRIVVLTDFHLQPFTQIGFLRRAVAEANAMNADVVVLLGDFVDATLAAIEELAPLLGTLRARVEVLAVLGNHDLRKGGPFVAEALRRAGITVLRNEGTVLPFGGAELHFAGTDSISGRFDLSAALARHRTGVQSVLLAHEPDVADFVSQDGRVSLQLSGHSHGAQVRLPGLEWVALPPGARRYPFGSYQLGKMFLHTSRGLGTTGIPVRFGSPPEITEVILTGV